MSLVEPSIDQLAEKVDSKYTLCMLAAKRAREIGDAKAKAIKKARVLSNSKSLAHKEIAKRIITKINASGKEVSVALREFAEDKLLCEHAEDIWWKDVRRKYAGICSDKRKVYEYAALALPEIQRRLKAGDEGVLCKLEEMFQFLDIADVLRYKQWLIKSRNFGE